MAPMTGSLLRSFLPSLFGIPPGGTDAKETTSQVETQADQQL